jgi:formylglycine-generating enzyme required for sulfatase activity
MQMKDIRYRGKALMLLAGAGLALFGAGAAQAAITIPMVPVGNAGNAADPSTGFGAVAYSYNIGQTDVTAGQYTAFLNSVAATDPYGLYNSNLSTATNGNFACGITQSGSPGSYTYTDTRNPNYPVNYVTWGDAARFANWLTNNQPTGAEGNGTTETGSYTLNGATSNAALLAVTRNANANYVIPTENEWYKAAYYNPASSSYYLYTTSSNTQPSNVLSATGTNNANYYNGGYTDPTNYLTPVGAFADSVSPYGTYDQGGDVFQWNESVYSGSYRGLRGGSFVSYNDTLQSGYSVNGNPTGELDVIGFRVSQVPEPASMGVLGLGVAGMLVRRRGARR